MLPHRRIFYRVAADISPLNHNQLVGRLSPRAVVPVQLGFSGFKFPVSGFRLVTVRKDLCGFHPENPETVK
jgi:hypothetical protein